MTQLILAPMEGVTDWVMRDVLTQVGGIDLCVTEFLRVTTQLHSKKVFYRWCPELHSGSKTRSGTPVFIQLLGGHAEPLAANAFRAFELGAAGIDLNFGCPAKTVNRHDGGASLLKSPERIYNIVKAVRQAVPASTPVTAKIRLGWENPGDCLETAAAAADAGATWLTVHCRTKVAGYRPPAHWDWIPRIQEKISIPVVANGDIQSPETFAKCRDLTGSAHFMIGRAALTDPFLFKKIKMKSDETSLPASGREALAPLIQQFFYASADYINAFFATARTKQWLKQLSINDAELREVFDRVKIHKKPQDFQRDLERYLN